MCIFSIFLTCMHFIYSVSFLYIIFGDILTDICTGQYHALPGHLDNQFALRDVFGHARGEDVMFCSWDCARKWNQKHTSVQLRHSTDRLICIAAGMY